MPDLLITEEIRQEVRLLYEERRELMGGVDVDGTKMPLSWEEFESDLSPMRRRLFYSLALRRMSVS